MCDYLSRRRGLLVLDTCEHVVEAVAGLATRLLARCPDLRILATTRQPLRAPGEQIVQLSGLDEAAGAEVFTSRARAANPSAELDTDRVRAIVVKLEGLPLALELAAARIASLSLEQLVTGLGQPLDALAGDALAGDPRHRTMRAVIGWSHDLLDARDREAFAALSVFVGSFDREAASAVVGDDASDAVDRLLGRSLLTRDVDLVGQARYRFLDPVRHFAQERATPSDARQGASATPRVPRESRGTNQRPDPDSGGDVVGHRRSRLRGRPANGHHVRHRRALGSPRVASLPTCTGPGFSTANSRSSDHGRMPS